MVSKSKKRRLKLQEETRERLQNHNETLHANAAGGGSHPTPELSSASSNANIQTKSPNAIRQDSTKPSSSNVRPKVKIELEHPSLKPKEEVLDQLINIYRNLGLDEDEPVDSNTVVEETKDRALRRMLRRYLEEADSKEYDNVRDFMFSQDEVKRAEDFAFERIDSIRSDRIKVRALLLQYGNLREDLTRLERQFVAMLEARSSLEKEKLYFENEYKKVKAELDRTKQKGYIQFIDLLKSTIRDGVFSSTADAFALPDPEEPVIDETDPDELLHIFKDILGRLGPENGQTLSCSDVGLLLYIQNRLLDVRKKLPRPTESQFVDAIMTQYELKEALFRRTLRMKELESQIYSAKLAATQKLAVTLNNRLNAVRNLTGQYIREEPILHNKANQLQDENDFLRSRLASVQAQLDAYKAQVGELRPQQYYVGTDGTIRTSPPPPSGTESAGSESVPSNSITTAITSLNGQSTSQNHAKPNGSAKPSNQTQLQSKPQTPLQNSSQKLSQPSSPQKSSQKSSQNPSSPQPTSPQKQPSKSPTNPASSSSSAPSETADHTKPVWPSTSTAQSESQKSQQNSPSLHELVAEAADGKPLKLGDRAKRDLSGELLSDDDIFEKMENSSFDDDFDDEFSEFAGIFKDRFKQFLQFMGDRVTNMNEVELLVKFREYAAAQATLPATETPKYHCVPQAGYGTDSGSSRPVFGPERPPGMSKNS